MIPRNIFFAGLLMLFASSAFAQSQSTDSAYIESGFLTDYSNLTIQASSEGTDRIYIGPGGVEMLVNYDALTR